MTRLAVPDLVALIGNFSSVPAMSYDATYYYRTTNQYHGLFDKTSA